MGQKIHPKAFRLGQTATWGSRWFADDRRYKLLFLQDVQLRDALMEKLRAARVESVEIERSINKVKVTLHVARPGVVIGRGGSGLEDVKKFIEQKLSTPHKGLPKVTKQEAGRVKVELLVEPVKEPNLSAALVAANIVEQLLRRMPHKRICNQAIERTMAAGAKGARIKLAGRIGGAEISRKEKFQAGTVPLSTIREHVDYASVPALTKSGYVGVKVWICKKS